MKIAVDGGALSGGKTYGTFRVTEQLLHAIQKYDHTNTYDIFTLPAPQIPGLLDGDAKVTFTPVLPAIGWMHGAVPWHLHQGKYDIFLALNQALPSWWRGAVIAISHGLSFLHFPDLYKQDYDRLKTQLDLYIRRSERIIVSSQRVQEELIAYAPTVANKTIALPFGVPFQLTRTQDSIPRKQFLLYVGSNQPIKNVAFLLEQFKKIYRPGYQLFLAGVPKTQSLVTIAGTAAQGLFFFPQVSLDRLRVLYRTAAATVSMSRYESFGFPLIEAASLRCPVVALESAVIPELRPFVTVSTEADFADTCNTYIKNPADSTIDLSALQSIFSWEQFVKIGIIDYAANRNRSR